MRKCSKCQTEKPLTEFNRNQWYCKPCRKADNRERYAKDPTIWKNASRRYYQSVGYVRRVDAVYGVDYDEMLAAQNGRCAVCATETPGGKGRFHVDHCRESGRVRGLLCHKCNRGAGFFGHDPERLRKMALYLEG